MRLYHELKRRNVFRVGAAYIVAAWLLIQVAETIFPLFGFGGEPARIVVVVLAIGFPLFLLFSWIFEIAPERLKKEKDIDRSLALIRKTGKQLDRGIIVLLALALGYFAFDKLVLEPARVQALLEETAQQARSEALVEWFGDMSIAVPPFVNMSDDAGNEYFSDGDYDTAIAYLESAVNRGLRDKAVFGEPIFEPVNDDPRFIALQAELGKILAREHGKVLQLICFNNPVPKNWRPMPETCKGVVEQRES